MEPGDDRFSRLTPVLLPKIPAAVSVAWLPKDPFLSFLSALIFKASPEVQRRACARVKEYQ